MLQRLLYQPEKGRTCEEQAEVRLRPRCRKKNARQQPPSTETTATQEQLGAPTWLLVGQREARRAGHHGRAGAAQELGQRRPQRPRSSSSCRGLKAPCPTPGPGPRPRLPPGQRASPRRGQLAFPEPQRAPSRLSPLDIAPVRQEIIEHPETSSRLQVPEAHGGGGGSGAADTLRTGPNPTAAQKGPAPPAPALYRGWIPPQGHAHVSVRRNEPGSSSGGVGRASAGCAAGWASGA